MIETAINARIVPVDDKDEALNKVSGLEDNLPAIMCDTQRLIELKDTAALKRKYGEVWQVEVTLGEDDAYEGDSIQFIFKKPSTASFNRYMKSASKNMAAATTIFVRDNMIEECVELFEEKSSQYPGLALGIGQKLLAAIGLGDNINFKKL